MQKMYKNGQTINSASNTNPSDRIAGKKAIQCNTRQKALLSLDESIVFHATNQCFNFIVKPVLHKSQISFFHKIFPTSDFFLLLLQS